MGSWKEPRYSRLDLLAILIISAIVQTIVAAF